MIYVCWAMSQVLKCQKFEQLYTQGWRKNIEKNIQTGEKYRYCKNKDKIYKQWVSRKLYVKACHFGLKDPIIFFF